MSNWKRRRIARTHQWVSVYRAVAPAEDGFWHAQHVYVCERCGHTSSTTATCKEARDARDGLWAVSPFGGVEVGYDEP